MTTIKQTIKALLIAAAFALVAVTAAACGSANAKQEPTRYTAIGKKASGKYVYAINTTNKTDRRITGLAIKTADDTDYPDNMLTAKRPFKKNQKRTLYYNAKAAIKAATGDSDKQVNPAYSVKLTFADDSTAELHDVPFDDIKTMTIAYDEDDGVAYLKYKSKGTKETVNTKADEVKVKQDAEAAAKKAAEEAAAKKAAEEQAAKQAAAAAAAKQRAASASSSSSTRSYSSSSSTRRSTYTAPKKQQAASGTSGGGCVGDGLTY